MTKIIIMNNTNKINPSNNNNKISNESLNKNTIVILIRIYNIVSFNETFFLSNNWTKYGIIK